MRPRATGHIVNVASSAGKTGVAGGATYCACKHGVVGLSEAVRAELRGSGVEISVVMPWARAHGAHRRPRRHPWGQAGHA
jgi:short-subunit dehydrogenase